MLSSGTSQKDSEARFPFWARNRTYTIGPQQYMGQLHQQIKLDPTGTNVLFAIGGISAVTPGEQGQYRYWSSDEVLQFHQPILRRMEYEVVSRDRLIATPWPPAGETPPARHRPGRWLPGQVVEPPACGGR